MATQASTVKAPPRRGAFAAAPDDGRGLPVEAEGLAGHAGDEFMEAPEIRPRLALGSNDQEATGGRSAANAAFA